MTMATAIKWTLEADRTYPGDVNVIGGTISAQDLSTNAQFKGSTSSEASVSLIASQYQNVITNTNINSYRLQHNGVTYGSYGELVTAYDVIEGTGYQPLTAYSNHITGSFLETYTLLSEDLTDSVGANIKATIYPAQLSITVQEIQTWLQALGTIGGFVSAIMGLVLAVMNRVQQLEYIETKLKESMVKKAAAVEDDPMERATPTSHLSRLEIAAMKAKRSPRTAPSPFNSPSTLVRPPGLIPRRSPPTSPTGEAWNYTGIPPSTLLGSTEYSKGEKAGPELVLRRSRNPSAQIK
jgi:hypothetical protein